MRARCFLVILLMPWLTLPVAAADHPRVAVSIAPLHSWVSQVSGDLWEPDLLLSAQVDPHNAMLRPSQRQRVEQADWIVWVGPQLETGLEALMRRVEPARKWTLTEDDVALVRHEYRRAGELFALPEESADHGLDIDFPGAEQALPRHGSGTDPHLWLDPENAKRALAHIADHLSELDPANARNYQANAESAIAQLTESATVWQARLDAAEPRAYVVFHDGYQYFDRRFGLPFAGAITLNPEQLPGLRTINEMRAAMTDNTLGCLFAEVQYSDRLVAAIGSGLDLDIQRLDALGAAIEPGPDHYHQLMTDLVDSFASCA